MNKKNSSQKELLVLLAILLLVIFYLIDRVILQGKIDELTTEKQNVQSQISAVQPLSNQMDTWDEELAKIYKKYDGQPKSIPDYNNINAVIAEMSLIFDGDTSYSISFSDPSFEDHIVTRNITISFSCAGYNEMISKLFEINNSDNRYRITNLSVSQSGEDSYSASFGIVAYEYSGEE